MMSGLTHRWATLSS